MKVPRYRSVPGTTSILFAAIALMSLNAAPEQAYAKAAADAGVPSLDGARVDRVIQPDVDRSRIRIEVGRNVQISVARSKWMHTEMQIAADPLDYRKLVACSIIGSSQQSTFDGERDILYSSNDQGLTWRFRVTSDGGASDPTCAYTSLGTALFIANVPREKHGSKPHSATAIYRSPDGGDSWSSVGDGPPLDNPGVAAGVADGKAVVWIGGMDLSSAGEANSPGECTYFLNPLVAVRSLDDGRSFSRPVRLINGPTGGYCLTQAGSAAMLADGTPVYPVLEIRQNPYQTPNLPGKPNSVLGLARIERARIAVSEIPHIYSDWTALWTTEKSAVAVDGSHGVFRNRMYAAWTDWRSGRSEVLLSYSGDRGATWATPRVVNDDRSFGEGRFGPDDTQVMLTVNKDGVVGVAWYSRAGSIDDLGWTVRFRASLDGGMTWLASVKVSSAANTFTVPRNWSDDFQVQPRGNTISIWPGYHAFHFFTGGDYSGITADAHGMFHPVWSDDRTGVSQMWTAQVQVMGVAHAASAHLDGIRYRLPAAAQMPPVPEYGVSGQKLDSPLRVSGVSDARYDARTRTFSFDARLENASPKPLHGPWRLYVEGLQSGYGEVRVVHTDNGRTGPGAFWTFRASSGDILNPGESSAPRRIFVHQVYERPFRVSDFWVPVVPPAQLARIDYRIATAVKERPAEQLRRQGGR
jgi:hypothetical protein